MEFGFEIIFINILKFIPYRKPNKMEEHNHKHPSDQNQVEEQSQSRLAFSATLHCLLGCGIGVRHHH